MASGVDGTPAKYLSLAEVKIPTQRNGKSGELVVKHTFLELEARCASVDPLPVFGRMAKSSSDPCMFGNPKYHSDLAADDMAHGDGGVGQPLGAQEEIGMTGFSDSDGDLNRSEDESTAYPSQSANGVESSIWESGVDDEQPEPLKAAAGEVPVAQKSPSETELLVNENTRLAAENAFWRQKCMEVAKAAETAAAATASAAAVYLAGADAPANSQADASAMPTPGAKPSTIPAASQMPPAAQGLPAPSHSGTMPSTSYTPMACFGGKADASAMPTPGAQPFTIPAASQMPPAAQGLPAPSPSGTMPSTGYTPMACFGGTGLFDGPLNAAWWLQMPDSCFQNIALPIGAVLASMPTAIVATGAGFDSSKVREKEVERVKSSSRPEGRGAAAHRGGRGARGARGSAADVSAPDESLGAPCTVPPEERTTVMMRNVPNNYTRQMLVDLLDSEGFSCQYDFIYLPADFKSRASLGYAFVNLTSPSATVSFMKAFNGFSNWILPSKKVCGVSWSGPHQGLAAHVERYRKSPVMHEAVPDAYRPAIFQDGVRISFPLPTRRLREPRVRYFPTSFMGMGSQNESKDAPSDTRHAEHPAAHVGKAEQDLANLSGDEQWWF